MSLPPGAIGVTTGSGLGTATATSPGGLSYSFTYGTVGAPSIAVPVPLPTGTGTISFPPQQIFNVNPFLNSDRITQIREDLERRYEQGEWTQADKDLWYLLGCLEVKRGEHKPTCELVNYGVCSCGGRK